MKKPNKKMMDHSTSYKCVGEYSNWTGKELVFKKTTIYISFGKAVHADVVTESAKNADTWPRPVQHIWIYEITEKKKPLLVSIWDGPASNYKKRKGNHEKG